MKIALIVLTALATTFGIRYRKQLKAFIVDLTNKAKEKFKKK